MSSRVSPRAATVERKTKETQISVEIALDGAGEYEIDTGIPFFDHMLESFARHAAFDLRITAKGDLEVDTHHTVEDVGITLGQALREALGTAAGIRRFGSIALPMAESKVDVALDLSNRPYLVYRVDLVNDRAKRLELGRRGREFALKWHSREAAGRRFEQIYRDLLQLPTD